MSYPLYRDVQRPELTVELIISRPDYVIVRDPDTMKQEQWTVEEFLLMFEPLTG